MSSTRAEKRSVLITTTAAASGLTCIRSLGSRGIRTIAASEGRNEAAFSSRYCDDAVTVPPSQEKLSAYGDALLSIATRSDVRTIIPTREVDAYLLAKRRDEFDPHVTALWPPFETIAAVHDRLKLSEAAEAAGIPVPETDLLTAVDDWDRRQVIKPRYSILTDAYVESRSTETCERLKNVIYLPPGEKPDRDEIIAEMRGHEPIVQEYVPIEDEYGFAALYDRGSPMTTFQKRHIRRKSYTGGPSVYRESVQLPQVERYGNRLLEHLDWHGLAEVQFLKDATDGEYKLLEINPFVWGSVACAVRAGADFPYNYWLLASGNRDHIEPGYDLGVSTHLLYGELEYLSSLFRDDNPFVERPRVGSEIWNVAASILTDPSFDYFRLDDPEPFVRGILDTVPLDRTTRETAASLH